MGSGPCTIYHKGSEIQPGHSFLLMHTYRLFYNIDMAETTALDQIRAIPGLYISE